MSRLPEYAKMFAAGIAAIITQSTNNILSLIPADPPIQVGQGFEDWLTFFVVAAAVALVPNKTKANA